VHRIPPNTTDAGSPAQEGRRILPGDNRLQTQNSLDGNNRQQCSGAVSLKLNANAVRDCAGQDIPDCDELRKQVERIGQAPDKYDDGWSEWMEEQIRGSLESVADQNHFSGLDVKCDTGGCVFFVAACTSAEMFGTGFQYHNSFDRWLRTRPWIDELQPNLKTNGDRSALAWKIVGTDSSPFVNWYVVKRRT
jgi:hypothetical protein